MNDNAIKFDDEKLRYDLIPPKALAKLAYIYTIGAKKYGDKNYLNGGLRWGRVFAAMMRHAWAFWGGENIDVENKENHLASVAWCAFTLMEYIEMFPNLDDRMKDVEKIINT